MDFHRYALILCIHSNTNLLWIEYYFFCRGSTHVVQCPLEFNSNNQN